MKDKRPICTVCKRAYDTTKKNYGWHQGSDGIIRHCVFPMLMTSATYRISNKNLRRGRA